MKEQALEKKAAQIRVDTISAMHKAEYGYVGSVMSATDLMVSLYYGDLMGKPLVALDPSRPGWEGQDYVIMSKSHAVVVQYAILADLGFYHYSELDFFGKSGSMLSFRPNLKVPGMAAANALPGQGLTVALGLAMAIKKERKNNRVFVVMGDGELQNGRVWETLMLASHYKLNNLVVLIDNNKLQGDGNIRGVVDINPIQSKFDSFGWKVVQVRDGHSYYDLLDGFEKAFTAVRQPVCMWCHTVTGKGLEFVEGKINYHKAKLSDSEMEIILPKLKAIYE